MLSGPPVTTTVSAEQLLERFLAANPRQRRSLLSQVQQRSSELRPLIPEQIDRLDATGDDWAAGLLSRYQPLRLRQHVERNVCGVVMSHAALAALAERSDLDGGLVAEFAARYQSREPRPRERLATIREEFPGFYERFEARMCQRAALHEALATAHSGQQHGHLGTKAYARLAERVTQALDREPELGAVAERPRPAQLIRSVPLFTGLSKECLAALAGQARPVTFLPGDVVIAEGQHGDALYLIARGAVAVTRRRDDDGDDIAIASLGDGDLFGEAAMLGEEVRNATVTATSLTTLLRLTRRDVLGLAEHWPEIGERLREVDAARHEPTT